MEKINIQNLGLGDPIEMKYIQIGDATISVKPRIPYEDLFAAIQWAVTFIMDERTFISGPLHEVMSHISVIKHFTNLDTSDIELVAFEASSLYEWYDILMNNDAIDKITNLIDKKQLEFFYRTLNATLTSLVEYRNSAAGIVERLQTLSQNNKNSLEVALSTLEDDERMSTLNKLMSLMGDGATLDDIAREAGKFTGEGLSPQN